MSECVKTSRWRHREMVTSRKIDDVTPIYDVTSTGIARVWWGWMFPEKPGPSAFGPATNKTGTWCIHINWGSDRNKTGGGEKGRHRKSESGHLTVLAPNVSCNVSDFSANDRGCGKFCTLDWCSQLGYVGFEFALQITFGAQTVFCLARMHLTYNTHKSRPDAFCRYEWVKGLVGCPEYCPFNQNVFNAFVTSQNPTKQWRVRHTQVSFCLCHPSEEKRNSAQKKNLTLVTNQCPCCPLHILLLV